MKKAPEKFRLITKGIPNGKGNNGFFVIPHERIIGYAYNCMISDGSGWEHVSITITSEYRKVERCPTWAEMCYVKSLFWEDEETVMQLHPPKSQWVSTHPYCLHLWKPTGQEIPLPLPEMVGLAGDNNQTL